jgi:Pyruvate/2-oxoacid:ferredoxin oxidoreductase delta subunit
MSSRQIIQIDEAKCNGCGQCIVACAEGALALVEGKARLVSEVYCDGLGACLGECPEGALTVVEREAPEFDPAPRGVGRHLQPKAAPACPSAGAMIFARNPGPDREAVEQESALGHWPVKLQLLGPGAPFLKGADLILTADCVPFALPEFHRQLLRGKAVAIGCPKLDDLEAHIERLSEILKRGGIKSLTVVRMEVPCCFGFVHAAREAAARSGVTLPIGEVVISRQGNILEQKTQEPG